MIKHFQLIAVGFILFGLLVFGAGIYLLAKESLDQIPEASSLAPQPTPQVAVVSNKAKTKSTPTPARRS